MCMADAADWNIEFSVKSNPKARKEHACYECARTIRPGENYEKISQKCDGYVETYKTCMHCASGPKAWLIEHCNGYLFGGISEDIREHIEAFRWEGRYADSMRMARLCVGMRRGWKSFKDPDALMRLPKL